MKILVVCSGNFVNFNFKMHQAFISDQIEASRFNSTSDLIFDVFFIKKRGYKGYLKCLPKIKDKIRQFQPDVVHAHGGHIGLLCCMQGIKPVIITFHGSDLNIVKNRGMSSLASFFCSASIFVSAKLYKQCFFKKKHIFIIPCGVNFDVFYPLEKGMAKTELGMDPSEKYLLFSSSFENHVKNFSLASKALSTIPGIAIREIANRTRREVNLLLNGAELLLMTSFSEGSPQIIKEAMACNCPIVSTDVGDVRHVLGNTPGCYIASFDPKDVARGIEMALSFGKRTRGREKIRYLDNRLIVQKIVNVYKLFLRKDVK